MSTFHFQIIYQITLPERMIGETFVEFMRDEYFPAVYKGPTRVGQVIGLSLLRGVAETHEGMNTFLMLVKYAGMATGNVNVDNEEVRQKFEALYGAHVERLGAYNQVAAWSENN